MDVKGSCGDAEVLPKMWRTIGRMRHDDMKDVVVNVPVCLQDVCSAVIAAFLVKVNLASV